jgi:hypothetical protein
MHLRLSGHVALSLDPHHVDPGVKCTADSNLYETKLVIAIIHLHVHVSAEYMHMYMYTCTHVGFRHPIGQIHVHVVTVVSYQTSLLRASKATLCTFSSPL